EKVGQRELVLELLQQVDDLRLNGDVERRDGLVGDDEVRIDRQCAGDPDPLALPAGELVWVAGAGVGREPDGLEQLAYRSRLLTAPDEAVNLHRLAHDPRDAVARVERGKGVLEDHLHPPAHLPQLSLALVGDVLAVKEDPARRRLVEAQDGAADGRLPAPGLADEAERLAPLDFQRDVVHRLDVTDVAIEENAALDREIDLQVLERNQGPVLTHSRSSGVPTCRPVIADDGAGKARTI